MAASLTATAMAAEGESKALRAVLLSYQNPPVAPGDLIRDKTAPVAAPAPAPKKKWGNRSKARIFGGLGLLGGGLAMVIVNPNIDDFQNELSNPNYVRKAGVVFMLPGAYLLWDGLRKR